MANRKQEYTLSDLFYYGGLFSGIIASYKILESQGVESQLIRLIVGLVVGIGMGWFLQNVYESKDKGGN